MSNTAMMMSKVLEIIQTEMAVLKIHFISSAVGYELAMRFTKGEHALVVATHTDR